jgi:sporulation integral membrane protein YlbJ
MLFAIISSNKRLWAGFLILGISIIIIIYPFDTLNAAKEGVNLWLFVVVPSLLPFFILNDMMVSLDVPKNISYVFSPILRVLYNTSGYGAYAFIMSIFSGYPSGAKITSSLIKSGQITSDEGQRILSFSSTSGPLFIIGAVGTGMLKSVSAGYLLFISHLLGAILNGIIYNIVFHKTPSNKSLNRFTFSKTPMEPSQLIGSSISSSLITCGYIGGYIVLFSVIIKLFNKINFFSIPFLTGVVEKLIAFLIQGSLEISSGSSIITLSTLPMEFKLILLSFIIGFGGLSILGQVAAVVSNTGIDMRKYALFKLTQGGVSSLICSLMLKTNIFSSAVFSAQPPLLHISTVKSGVFFLFEALLALMLILNLIGHIIKQPHSKGL